MLLLILPIDALIAPPPLTDERKKLRLNQSFDDKAFIQPVLCTVSHRKAEQSLKAGFDVHLSNTRTANT
ncbi:MAG: hypothetical protein ACU83N_04985 [Gammaproteobacteria bacterium]